MFEIRALVKKGKIMSEKKTVEVAVLRNYSLDKPADIASMANVLKTHIVKSGLYSNIKGKNYVQVEGWAFAGFLTGLNAVIEEVKDLSTEHEIKWSAVAKVYFGEKLVSIGHAVCSNREATKKSFDEYAILSMAQTRAIGKAYRSKLGFIIKMAGYESTPSEEMKTVDGREANIPAEKSTPVKVEAKEVKPKVEVKSMCGNCGKEITKPEFDYSTKLYGVPACRDCQKNLKKK